MEDGVNSEDLDLLAELFRLRQQYHKENLRRLFGTAATLSGPSHDAG